MGVDRSVPVGFTAIRLKFDLDCGETPKDTVSSRVLFIENSADRMILG